MYGCMCNSLNLLLYRQYVAWNMGNVKFDKWFFQVFRIPLENMQADRHVVSLF